MHAMQYCVALHSIENYEIFKKASEKHTQYMLLNRIDEDGLVELFAPKVGVTVMTSEAEIVSEDVLTREKKQGVTISYL